MGGLRAASGEGDCGASTSGGPSVGGNAHLTGAFQAAGGLGLGGIP